MYRNVGEVSVRSWGPCFSITPEPARLHCFPTCGIARGAVVWRNGALK